LLVRLFNSCHVGIRSLNLIIYIPDLVTQLLHFLITLCKV
jgi:hypothetical protein